jgi:formylglycine-generating enzyme required for sulfatase activity
MHASYDPGDGDNCNGDSMPHCAVTDLVPVGTKPLGDGRWGQSDLAGNIDEWMLDWYALTYANPCTDCADLTAATDRVTRGGGFDVDSPDLRTGSRSHNLTVGLNDVTMGRDVDLGVRCARAP